MTAVEWLFHKYKLNDEQIFADDYNQAREMEKHQMELPNVGRDTAEYIDRNIIEAMKEVMAKQPITFVPDEISDEEILKAAKECRFEDFDISVGSFELGARWYREQLKQKK